MNNIWFVVLLTIAGLGTCLDNGLALKPPLIVSTANLDCKVDEAVIRKVADEVVAKGLARVGYKYILIDDCWQV